MFTYDESKYCQLKVDEYEKDVMLVLYESSYLGVYFTLVSRKLASEGSSVLSTALALPTDTTQEHEGVTYPVYSIAQLGLHWSTLVDVLSVLQGGMIHSAVVSCRPDSV